VFIQKIHFSPRTEVDQWLNALISTDTSCCQPALGNASRQSGKYRANVTHVTCTNAHLGASAQFCLRVRGSAQSLRRNHNDFAKPFARFDANV